MTRLAYWAAAVLCDTLDLAAHLAHAWQDWHEQREWRAVSPAITTRNEVCPNDEHRANSTCHECSGSGIVDDYEGERPCARCAGRGHTACPQPLPTRLHRA